MQKSSSNATEISIYGMETLDQSNLPDREPRPLHHIGVTNSLGHNVTILDTQWRYRYCLVPTSRKLIYYSYLSLSGFVISHKP